MKNEEIDKFNNEENGDAKGDALYNEVDEVNIDELSYILPEELKIAIENLKISLKNELPKPRKIKLIWRKTMSQKFENTKNVALAITKLVNAGMQSYSDDGKITWGDIGHFIKIIPAIITAIPSLNHVKDELKNVKDAFKDIPTSELNDFREAILNEIEIKNESDKEFVKYIFDLLHILSKLVANRTERGKEIDNE
jgi:hypothetical protein